MTLFSASLNPIEIRILQKKHMLDVIHWNPDPAIFSIGSFQLRWYSLLFAGGFLIGYIIMKRIFKREGVNLDWLDQLLFYIFLGAIIGARLGHCLFYDYEYYSQHVLEIFLPVKFEPSFQFTGFMGLASHGGAIGIVIALLLFNRKVAKKHWMWIFDRIVIPIALAGAFIRTGNLMNSEIIGKAAEVPWAFVFEKIDQIPRHPVQLYEAISYILIFALLWIMYWYTQAGKMKGVIFSVFLIVLWGMRFILEYFKRSQGGLEEYFGQNLSTGQLLSIPFILVGMILLIIFRNQSYDDLEYK
jgi:prolipoprotein diacylglyceryl transferase